MRLFCASLVLVSVAACSGSSDPESADFQIARLEDRKGRNDALKKLARIGDKKAIPEIVKLLKEDGDWQPDAAYALGQLGDPSVVPDLIAAIDFAVGPARDKKSTYKNRTNQNVAKALGLLKAQQGADALIKLIGSSEQPTREAAIRSLGAIEAKSATDALVKVATTDENAFIRKIAIESLGNIRDPKAVPALIQLLYIEMPGISFYYEARFALLQIGKPAIAELLTTLKRQNKAVEDIKMADGNPVAEGAIEAKAAFVLASLRATETEADVIAALDKLFKRYKAPGNKFASIPGAVMELAYALGSIGSAASVKALTPVALDSDPNVRVSATESLTTIGDESAVPTLFNAAKSGPTEARGPAIVALSRLAPGDQIDAYDALAKITGKDIDAAALAEMVKGERPRIAAAKECGKDGACWKKKLTDADNRVRERAAYQLGWLGDKAAIADLMKAAEDSSAQVRMAAILSLDRLGPSAPELQALYDKYRDKSEFQNVNLEIQRIVARLGGANKG